MGRKGWLNVTILITIKFLTPARDLKSSDADERGGPDLPVLPAGQESASHIMGLVTVCCISARMEIKSEIFSENCN